MSAARPRCDSMTVFLHWALMLAVTVSLLTGLQIAADAEDAVWSRALRPLLLQGEVLPWHVWSSLLLTFVAVAYVAFLLRARLTARVALSRRSIMSLTAPKRRMRWRAVNLLLYWAAFALLLGMAGTGLLLYVAPGLLPHRVLTATHRVLAWGFLAFVPLHVAAQVALGGAGQLLKIVTPRLAYGAAGAVALAVGGAATAAVVLIDGSTVRSLRLERVSGDAAPRIDGRFDDRAWDQARPVTVRTTRGANFAGGEVPVTVRGVHDGATAYFLFEWPDPTRSQKHLPLVKTDRGWRVLQTEYGIEDEDHFYEDKFAVMLARSPGFAGGTTHLGPRPLPGMPGGFSGRGLHFTEDGSVVDVWHWKSVRTGPMGMIDDNHFGPPLAATPAQAEGKKRYTGGYAQDPVTAGGFHMNWEAFSADLVRPRYLPRTPELLRPADAVLLDPNRSDEGQWWLPLDQAVPYSEDLDRYPVGTVMPSVVIGAPFAGDRGDVPAAADWRDGRWRLEARRKLDTGSPYDVPIADGTFLWVAAFDHSQTRHSWHLHPLRIELGR